MDMEDASPQASYCKRFYDQTRDEVLQSSRWNFATKRAILSQLSEVPISEWAIQYQLPEDCLAVSQMNGFQYTEREGNFEVEGGRLLTNADSASIKYIGRVEDSNLFTPLFIEAFATKLAANLAVPLTNSNSTAEAMTAKFTRLTAPSARRADANEGRPKRKMPWVESDLVRSRFGGY